MTFVAASTAHRARPQRRAAWGLSGTAALAAALLLTGCTGGSEPAASPSASSSAATASSTPSSTPASPLPSAEVSVQGLVKNFPATLIPLLAGATVTGSSLQPSTPLSTVSLTATTSAPAADILAYYTGVFTAQGFTAQPGDAVDGLPTKTFVRAEGTELIDVSVKDDAGTSVFTVGATVLPASLQ